MNGPGSTWQRWDLHVHTPASFHWSGKQLKDHSPEDLNSTLQLIVDRMNAVDVAAFGVMDYWTFDGYIALRSFLNRQPTKTTRLVLPGIELRLEAPTKHRLNTHVLLDNALSDEMLRTFLAQLKIGGPSGKPPIRENLIALARGYDAGKLRTHGFKEDDRTDDERMHLLGLQTAVVTRESLENAIATIGAERCLVIQPYDTNDGLEPLDWQAHPYTDSHLMKLADMFECRKELHVSLFLGHGHPTKPHIGLEFITNLGGFPKPVVSGSDAHRIQDYGVYPSDRVTWLRARPTFAGLRQVCNEPALRCYIGVRPPKSVHVDSNPTRYMKRLRVIKVSGSPLDESWFDGFEVELNPGLVAIIGNKGSGKSAIADILALCGNARCDEMEFLNDRRFRSGRNRAKEYEASLTWMDDTSSSVRLDSEWSPDEPERARYLPQQFIENLCNEIAEGNETSFGLELKKVIFSHVSVDNRLNKASLDDLIEYLVATPRAAIAQLHGQLNGINTDIIAAEHGSSGEIIRSFRALLTLKQAELDAHDRTPPKEIEAPGSGAGDAAAQTMLQRVSDAQSLLDSLSAALEKARAERKVAVAREALLKRLTGHVENFATTFSNFTEKNQQDFADAGFSLTDVLRLQINRGGIDAAIQESQSALAQLSVRINGDAQTPGLQIQFEEATKLLSGLRDQLDAPQRAYQAFLAERERWIAKRAELLGTAEIQDTIEFLKNQIADAEHEAPKRLAALRLRRVDMARAVHGELSKIIAVYKQLYEPVQSITASGIFSKEALQLDFDAFLSPSRFEDDFLEFVHRNRRGNFYGEDESVKAVRTILARHDMNSSDGVGAFLDEMMSALTVVRRDGVEDRISIQSQLKANKKLSDLYDFLFGLKYLEPRYSLRLGSKDISQLSPGEKGALLLVFYLLLDPEEIPMIIDQPEQNLDNESVVRLLVDCIRTASARRQVVIVTHNPNLAITCDADQIVFMSIDKAGGYRVSCISGAIEDQPVNKASVDVLEGTYPAFDNRRKKYYKPSPSS